MCGKSLQLISRYVWTWFAEAIDGNVLITRKSGGGMSVVCRWIYKDNVCKEQWWAPNISSEEFQRVGRTILIKSKMFSFSLYINNNINPDFQTFDSFLQSYNPFKISTNISINQTHYQIIFKQILISRRKKKKMIFYLY